MKTASELLSGVTQVTEVTAFSDGDISVTPPENAEVTGVTESPIPSLKNRPKYVVLDDWHESGGTKYRPGVWYFAVKETKDESIPFQTWICSPLHIEAITSNGHGDHFGRLLRFRNTLSVWREWAMPMELLRAAGEELRGALLSMGVEIDPAARNQLANYIQARPPKRRICCALQVGWSGDSYVLPERVIGPNAADVIFQSSDVSRDEIATAGTLEQWQAAISQRAPGNPLLVLALSCAFAGPLLAKCNAEGGGIHFIGDSSTGKTTLLEAACSVWGGPTYKRSWRATSNGTEGAAVRSNDGLLALDEISECDPREVGAIVYALGNGTGKQRASRTGAARSVTRWRCFVLSSGERSIATSMQEGGYRVKAGQSVRLLDVPAARKYGAWDELHDLANGTQFSDAIKSTCGKHFGHAGRAFLEKLTLDRQDFCARLDALKALPEFTQGGEGQDKRAAGRFAVVALAGELATEYGLTGWPAGEATKAAVQAFKAWQGERGQGNDEKRQIIERVQSFIDRHGDARFSNTQVDQYTPVVRDRAGWWRDCGPTLQTWREYLFTADGLREALKGFDFRRALDELERAGVVPKAGADGKRSRLVKIDGRALRLYPVNANAITQ
jgi:putative DNA primase/helicase